MYPLQNRSGYKLYDMCYNYRREHGLLTKRKVAIEQEEEPDESADAAVSYEQLDEYEAELKRINPRSNELIEKCKKLMDATRPRRQFLITTGTETVKTTTDILDRWPVFRSLPWAMVSAIYVFFTDFHSRFKTCCTVTKCIQYYKSIGISLLGTLPHVFGIINVVPTVCNIHTT